MSSKHTFTFSDHEAFQLPSQPLARAILEVLNGLEDELEVAQIHELHFENTYLVKMALHSESLDQENKNGIIKHVAHVSLICDGIPTIIGVWERVGESKILL